MLFLVLFIILLLFLCITQENYENYKEITPYSHKSIYCPRYKKHCDFLRRNCLNTRCVYDNLISCQDNCKNGCIGCADGKYGCYMQ